MVPMGRAVVVALVITLIAGACSYKTYDLEPTIPVNAESSLVLAADGSVLATLHAGENREEIAYERIPKHVVDAVVAIEDRRYWGHRGVDFRAILRAALRDIEAGAAVEGGSTITQQYVKNAILARALQGGDPRVLPEHRLLRERRLRHPGCSAGVLRQEHRRAHGRRGSPARGPDQIAEGLRPVPRRRGGCGPT